MTPTPETTNSRLDATQCWDWADAVDWFNAADCVVALLSGLLEL